jgi:hypothetical protein
MHDMTERLSQKVSEHTSWACNVAWKENVVVVCAFSQRVCCHADWSLFWLLFALVFDWRDVVVKERQR